ncbi:CUB and sushi domain-containing protein 1-like [Mytilus galloprovincialis]|uniref:CUB and sushi domain-containing protein 1-like n=1 Tax=Mytilus galloprovincialis TaxID=29158 RepID=UPI003F7C4F6F
MQQKPVTCPNPPVVSFATKSSQTGSTYLDKITYTCDKGYERTGGYLVRTCKEDKTWDGSPPVCSIVTCPNPPDVAFATISSQTGSNYNDSITYTCNIGYESTDGTLDRKCNENKLWDGTPPVCTIVTCPNPPDVAFATISSQTGSNYNDSITYTCDIGYESTDGTLDRKCNENKLWDGTPPVCTIVTCPNPPDVAFATISSQTGSNYNDSITYTCNIGYESTDGTLDRKCNENKLWDGTPPVCTIVTCPNPPDVAFATISSQTGSNYNDSITYTCDIGYESTDGTLDRKCNENKLWDGTPPVCTIVTCPNPPDVAFATISSQTGSNYNDSITYTCNIGYESTDGTLDRKCNENKLWDGTPPVCTIITCPNPPDVAFATISSQTGLHYNDKITYTCNIDYENKDGTLVRKCMENKLWDGTIPVCSK